MPWVCMLSCPCVFELCCRAFSRSVWVNLWLLYAGAAVVMVGSNAGEYGQLAAPYGDQITGAREFEDLYDVEWLEDSGMGTPGVWSPAYSVTKVRLT